MNILFISKLSGNLWAGPNNSVPAQINAQQEFDNCFWYNLNDIKLDNWTINGLDCKNLIDYKRGRLNDLPNPFNRPDIAVVEEVYCYPFQRIISDLIKQSIPYVIVPRSTLTKQAQGNKSLKKAIGNAFWFNHMVRNASALQYLTEAEMRDSIGQWRVRYNIIPNGIKASGYPNGSKIRHGINGVYIGRVDIYQKGFDILIEAIAKVQSDLRSEMFHLNVYGPNREDAYIKVRELSLSYGVEDIISINGPVYNEEKKQILQNADVFIMSSRFEGLPMSLIEAISYGIPCVITKGTNLVDEVQQNKAGWVAENNSDSLAKALHQMTKEQRLFDEKGNNAYLLSKAYSWREIAKKTHMWLYEIVNGKDDS